MDDGFDSASSGDTFDAIKPEEGFSSPSFDFAQPDAHRAFEDDVNSFMRALDVSEDVMAAFQLAGTPRCSPSVSEASLEDCAHEMNRDLRNLKREESTC